MGDAQQIAHQHRHRRAPAAPRRVELHGRLRVRQAQVHGHLLGQQHNVAVDEEETGQVVLLDEAELQVQALTHLRGDTAVPPLGRLIANAFEVGLGRVPFRRGMVRELVPQVLSQVERGAAPGDAGGVFHRLGTPLEQAGHRLRGL